MNYNVTDVAKTSYDISPQSDIEMSCSDHGAIHLVLHTCRHIAKGVLFNVAAAGTKNLKMVKFRATQSWSDHQHLYNSQIPKKDGNLPWPEPQFHRNRGCSENGLFGPALRWRSFVASGLQGRSFREFGEDTPSTFKNALGTDSGRFWGGLYSEPS